MRAFVSGIGIISAAGRGLAENIDAVKNNASGIDKPGYFKLSGTILPVGEIKMPHDNPRPRTHAVALDAAEEALSGFTGTIDAVVMGVTTGGMPKSEKLMREKVNDPEEYALHSNGSVAETIARQVKCAGPVITISTACSSGTAAVIVAKELIQSGKAKNVLAGGSDGLCMLTYYGFKSLQLIDPGGARPFDRNRLGMTVAEGAAMILLTGESGCEEHAFAEIISGGLSCDAYHPAAPHPDGDGALEAMTKALADSGLSISDIEYINLHGTGTVDNDLAEAKAIRRLFGSNLPPVSSIKGAFGHTLGASGAIEVAITSVALSEGILPGNYGFKEKDPEIDLVPQVTPEKRTIKAAISNSFGFGGNNASVILASPGFGKKNDTPGKKLFLNVNGAACITGAGNTRMTMGNLFEGKNCLGALPVPGITENIPARFLRRLKRTSLLSLSAAISAHEHSGLSVNPSSVYYGTGWGGLTETNDFLHELFSTDEQFASPTNFINSVHNAAAGHLAIFFKAQGNNLTTTGVNYSFEQALFTAQLLARDDQKPLLVVGADEYQDELSPLFDQSVRKDNTGSDGAGAFIVTPSTMREGITLSATALLYDNEGDDTVDKLHRSLSIDDFNEECAVIFAGIPGALREKSEEQLARLIRKTGYTGPVFDYRKYIGEHSSASAVASVISYNILLRKELPAAIAGDHSGASFRGSKILLLGLGDIVTGVEMVSS